MSEQSLNKGNAEDYQLIEKLGRGRYGEVFKAFNITNNEICAIKVLKPIRSDKVIREINVLNRVKRGPNIINLRDVVINEGIQSLVFKYVSKSTLKDVLMDLSEFEIKYYMFQLLRAIEFAHNCGIIHRDIKPTNVMIDRNRKKLRVIDWGLAEFHSIDNIYSVSVASRNYKSPELLLNNNKYDYSLDIWSFGCILAGVIFRREPFFLGMDNIDQLREITKTLGSKALKECIEKYSLNNFPGIHSFANYVSVKKSWKSYTCFRFEHLVTESALDLIDKILLFDHKYRLTAFEAICHPFFDIVRNIKV